MNLPFQSLTKVLIKRTMLVTMAWLALGLNAADTNLNYVIPDLRAWNEVKEGLPIAELEKLLGQPIRKFGPYAGYEPGFVYPWTYGYVAKKSEVFPDDFAFVVNIQLGKVWSKEDPFGGVAISQDGFPTAPRLMSPPNSTVFNHYPRLVDFRWYASSGDYPMKYEIDINVFYPSGKWSQSGEFPRVSIPYHNYSHTGTNRGRWRVRAVNSKGTSPWSKYFYFDFKV